VTLTLLSRNIKEEERGGQRRKRTRIGVRLEVIAAPRRISRRRRNVILSLQQLSRVTRERRGNGESFGNNRSFITLPRRRREPRRYDGERGREEEKEGKRF